MPQAVRLTDLCTGHDCFPPRPNITASENVLINNLGAHREGDSWKEHCCYECHPGDQISGSPSVFVNNKPQARVGDFISCGSMNMTGSSNVIVN